MENQCDPMRYNTGYYTLLFDTLQTESFIMYNCDTLLSIDIYDSLGIKAMSIKMSDLNACNFGNVLEKMQLAETNDLGNVQLATISTHLNQGYTHDIVINRNPKGYVDIIFNERNVITGQTRNIQIMLDINDPQYELLQSFLYLNFVIHPNEMGYTAEYYYTHLAEFINDDL